MDGQIVPMVSLMQRLSPTMITQISEGRKNRSLALKKLASLAYPPTTTLLPPFIAGNRLIK